MINVLFRKFYVWRIYIDLAIDDFYYMIFGRVETHENLISQQKLFLWKDSFVLQRLLDIKVMKNNV